MQWPMLCRTSYNSIAKLGLYRAESLSMRLLRTLVYFLVVAFLCGISTAQQATEYMVSTAEPGVPGGRLVVAQRAEPKTLNPVVLLDQPSRELVRRLHADLIHINRNTQKTEPALAKSW